MNTKKTLSLLLAVGITVSAAYAVPVIPGVDQSICSIVAEATTPKASGKITEIKYEYNSKSTLYFLQDPSDNHLEVCGSMLKENNSWVEIPSTVEVGGIDRPVTAISHHAFQDQTNLSNIVIGDLPIGGAAFYNCTNLVCVYGTPDFIGDSAFTNCVSLQNAGIAASASHIGSHAFWGCSGMQTIVLHNVSDMGTAAFYDCTGSDRIDISSAPITSLPDFAFYNCSSATRVNLPDGLASIGVHSFSNCDSLDKIFIPDSVTNIGLGAFYECDMLKTVLMSENIISIGDYAFYCCPQMKVFVSKNPNASIGYYALGYHLENSHLLKNNDFVIWSTGSGRVKNYANNYGLTFHNINEAASLASDRYLDYEWRKSNTIAAWSHGGRLYFNEQHLPYENGHFNKLNNGICSGMAAVSVLTSSNKLQVSDYAPGYDKLSDINGTISMPDDVISYVTTVFSNINRSSFDYETDISTHRLSEEMMRYAEYITYGEDAAVFIVEKYKDTNGPHATVCFGMEYRENAADKNDACWDGWDARLLIYNVNELTHNKNDYVYINLTDGSWYSELNLKNDGNVSDCNLMMQYKYENIVNTKKYNMTVDEFFEAIKNQ
ncbi:leucine-rich repeat domain-containing protein [Ruminococcus sp. XPD3002]|uniref:leucine-rich repeat domain-containing protein n=1 Tax=Ruminococcus sp. XPD3002 TaxID=1452269 RepID=UPI0009187156|nr:Leucine rich repeat-containing protein [Ruminococcus flavefaciens]